MSLNSYKAFINLCIFTLKYWICIARSLIKHYLLPIMRAFWSKNNYDYEIRLLNRGGLSYMLLRTIVIFTTLSIFLFAVGSQPLSGGSSLLNPDSLWCKWEYESILSLRVGKIDQSFKKLQKKRRFNGTILIAEDGHIIHKGAYGYANMRTKDTLSIHSSFQLASVSKIFTATAILLLYEEGKIDLDDEVRTHIKGFPYKDMTIRNLLNHRSGMGRYMATAGKYWKTWREPMDNDDVVYQYRRYKPPIFFTPDNGFNYCNTNYVFLASLVESVSGLSFAEFCQKRIFEPLDMKNSIIYSRKTDPDIPNEAIGYKASWRGWRKAANDYIDGVVGDKGMYSSAYDLFLFDQALRKNTLLKPETLELAYTPGSPFTRRRYQNYGLGWRIDRYRQDVPYHFGWWRGFRTCFIRDLTQDRTIIILANVDIPGRNLRYWDVYKYVTSMDWEKGFYEK